MAYPQGKTGRKPKRASGEAEGKKGTLAKQMRDITRLLARDIPNGMRIAKEAEMQELQKQVALKNKSKIEQKYERRYKHIKFFEWRKVDRALRQLAKKEKNGETVTAEEKARKAQLERDLDYITNYPKDEKYIALFAKGTDSSESCEKERTRIRDKIKKEVATVALLSEENEGLTRTKQKKASVAEGDKGAAGRTLKRPREDPGNAEKDSDDDEDGDAEEEGEEGEDPFAQGADDEEAEEDDFFMDDDGEEEEIPERGQAKSSKADRLAWRQLMDEEKAEQGIRSTLETSSGIPLATGGRGGVSVDGRGGGKASKVWDSGVWGKGAKNTFGKGGDGKGQKGGKGKGSGKGKPTDASWGKSNGKGIGAKGPVKPKPKPAPVPVEPQRTRAEGGRKRRKK